MLLYMYMYMYMMLYELTDWYISQIINTLNNPKIQLTVKVRFKKYNKY